MMQHPYKTIIELINNIDEHNRASCLKLYKDNEELFNTTAGSSYNHQAWPGGYKDHIEEIMNIAIVLYDTFNCIRALPFTLADVMIVLYVHDLEKLWKDDMNAIVEQQRIAKDMKYYFNKHYPKHHRKAFRQSKIEQNKIILTEQQQNALDYVEGENYDYSSKYRVMNELAAFCHMCDVWSARGWHDYPKKENDPWRHIEYTTL